MSHSSKETAAIVLDCRDHGESDQIITFFCQDIGRMTGIAKGAKRSQKRFVNKLELFSSLRIRYTESRSSALVFIAEAELVESFISLRRNMSLYMAATVLRELTLSATRDLEGDDGIFPLLQWGLQSMDAQRPLSRRGAFRCKRHLSGPGCVTCGPRDIGATLARIPAQSPVMNILAMFQIKFFEQIGYRPNLDFCLRCHQPFSIQQEYGFDCRGGGIVCGRCQREGEQASVLSLSRGTIKILASAQNQPLHRLHRLHLSGSCLGEALSLLCHYGHHLLQRELCSLQILSDAHGQEG
jgi:DNA repair protein RecO (recombination protein O)